MIHLFKDMLSVYQCSTYPRGESSESSHWLAPRPRPGLWASGPRHLCVAAALDSKKHSIIEIYTIIYSNTVYVVVLPWLLHSFS